MFLRKLSLLSKQNCYKYIRQFSIYQTNKKPPWAILFFGADDFSVFSLKALTREYRKGELIRQLEVITTIKGKLNPVHLFATKENLNLYKWPNFPENEKYDVGIVVSFGHLIPGEIIDKFPFGILNVHGSLLPRWRGAAPIVYAIANGDNQTGITIMRIKSKKFDIGDIVIQTTVNISNEIKLPDLYKQMGNIGADNLIKTLENLPNNLENAIPQLEDGVTYAPKLTADFACIKWDTMTSINIYNLERALSGLFSLRTTWNNIPIKLIGIRIIDVLDTSITKNNIDIKSAGFVKYNKLTQKLNIKCVDEKWIEIEKVGVLGKKIMSASDFHNGFLTKVQFNCRYFK